MLSNLNHIKKNTFNKFSDLSNDRMQFVGNKMPTVHNPRKWCEHNFEASESVQQASTRMNERFLELTSYVNAMKKKNKSDNFVPSTSSSQLI